MLSRRRQSLTGMSFMSSIFSLFSEVHPFLCNSCYILPQHVHCFCPQGENGHSISVVLYTLSAAVFLFLWNSPWQWWVHLIVSFHKSCSFTVLCRASPAMATNVCAGAQRTKTINSIVLGPAFAASALNVTSERQLQHPNHLNLPRLREDDTQCLRDGRLMKQKQYPRRGGGLLLNLGID